MRAAIYCRVSTLDQNPQTQLLDLQQLASQRGFEVIQVYTDHGISEANKTKIFEPFYSTKSGGSGLGLPTARKIIEAHGGRIGVHSEVGRGTQFTLEFPTPPRIESEES